MSDKPDGGPAFPQSVAEIQGGATVSHDFQDGAGMSLRDYFAGQVLTGLMLRSTNEAYGRGLQATAEKYGVSQDEIVAKTCYQIADAMITEGAK